MSMVKIRRDKANDTLRLVQEWCADKTGSSCWPSSFNTLTQQVWYSDHKREDDGWEVGFIITVQPRGAFFRFILQVSVRDTLGAYTSVEVNLDDLKTGGTSWKLQADDLFRALCYLCRGQVSEKQKQTA